MRTDQVITRWVGTALALVGVAATVWLAVTDRLTLYIHPRYTVFTVLLAVVAGAAAVAAIVVGTPTEHEHGHDEHEQTPAERPTLTGRVRRTSLVTILAVAVVALLVLPPSTLSSTTRQNRDLVTSGHALDSTDTTVLIGGNSATFTVKDWAALLREGGAGAVLGREADLSGYVLDQGDDDVFYTVRLLVSCCAVDAQPVGVPVYRPGWRSEFAPGDWVALRGTFVDVSARSSRFPTALKVTTIAKIAEPRQPYVF